MHDVPFPPHSSASHPARAFPRANAWAAALVSATLLAACQDHRPLSSSQASHPVGTVLDHPDPTIGSKRFVVEENSGGGATNLRIVGVAWGRLVNVRDQLGALQHTNYLVGEDIVSDGIDYDVSTNSVTLETTVTILYPYTPSLVLGGVETSPYQRAFAALDRNLGPIDDKSLDPSELPPFSLVPRNATLVVRFNDLLDPTTINPTNVRLLVGYPPSAPLDARVLPDINHGDARDTNGDGVEEFFTTRLLIDPAVTPFESSTAEIAIAPNTVGLPASVTANQPNIVVRIPTRVDPPSGQNSLLRNLSGHAVAFISNGSRDDASATHDLVRAVRSGGKTVITGDVNNGFLADTRAPRVVGAQAIVIGTPTGGPDEFVSTVTFLTPTCAMPTKVGDVLQQPGVFAEVTQVALPVGAQIGAVHYRVVFPQGGFFSAGQGTLSTVWDPVINQNQQACFVRFPSVATPPATAVSTTSSVLVRFNEPMDPDSVSSFGSFAITNFDPAGAAPAQPERASVVGRVTPSTSAQDFRFEPLLPFKHTAGSSEAFWVNVSSSANGVRDLAGNPLAIALPPVRFTLSPSDPTENTGNVMLRFSAFDEIAPTVPPAAPQPEVRGQVQIDFVGGELKPRAVERQAVAIDRSRPTVNAMTPLAGETTPLSQYGSKLMTLWRYVDMGIALLDESSMNMDVEGLSWAPIGGAVIADVYQRFQVTLATSVRLPDEGFDFTTMNTFPNSGVFGTYLQNFLDTGNDPPKVVHPRERGYIVNPSDRFTTSTGTVMMPFPVNRGIPPEEKRFYTWRDTALQDKGGIDSAGAEMEISFFLPGIPVAVGAQPGMPFSTMPGFPQTTKVVPSIGLPLLMEFKTYPDDGALGLNLFDTGRVVLNGQPNVRAFSTGGVATGGSIVLKDPDLQSQATGGFNPASAPPGGATPGVDNVFYLGELNLVTRISRAHTIWFSTGILSTRYATPLMEPSPEQQPTGTAVVLAFRGASAITLGPTAPVLNNATRLDFYGDAITPGTDGSITFLNADNRWKEEMNQINGSSFFQTRLTFVSNAQTNLSPTLSSLGFAFQQ